MTAEEFKTASIALLRSAVGWQSAIARRLGVESRTVRRWLRAGAVPEWVADKFAELIGLRTDEAFAWPRDEWIVGDGIDRDGQRREYVVHTVPPRFIARVVACDPDGLPELGEEPADVVSGVVYSDGDDVLCEIDWIDEPDPGQVTQLLEAAADALERSAD